MQLPLAQMSTGRLRAPVLLKSPFSSCFSNPRSVSQRKASSSMHRFV